MSLSPPSTTASEPTTAINLTPTLKIYSKYFQYLVTGEFSDVTIYAPLPPSTQQQQRKQNQEKNSKFLLNNTQQRHTDPNTLNNTSSNNDQYGRDDITEQLDPLGVTILSKDMIKPTIPTNRDQPGIVPKLTRNIVDESDNNDDDRFNLFKQPNTTTTTTTTSTTTTSTSIKNQQTSSSSSQQQASQLINQSHPIPGQEYMTFNLHRFILAARSPILAILLQRSPILYIGLRSDVFQALVWFMYTDDNLGVNTGQPSTLPSSQSTKSSTPSHVPSHLYPYLVWAADYYAIRPAQIWTLQFTMRLIRMENVVEIANGLLNTYSEIIPSHPQSSSQSQKQLQNQQNQGDLLTTTSIPITTLATSTTTSTTSSIKNINQTSTPPSHLSSNSTSFLSSTSSKTLIPLLSAKNCPKAFLYILDFIIHAIQRDSDIISKDISSILPLGKLHPQIQSMIIETGTISKNIFEILNKTSNSKV